MESALTVRGCSPFPSSLMSRASAEEVTTLRAGDTAHHPPPHGALLRVKLPLHLEAEFRLQRRSAHVWLERPCHTIPCGPAEDSFHSGK